MPPPGHKKVPFSAKKKKEQLRNKRERKRNAEQDEERSTDSKGKQEVTLFNPKAAAEDAFKEENDEEEEEIKAESSGSSKKDGVRVRKFNEQPTNSSAKSYDPNRYRLHFVGETREDVERGKKLAHEPLSLLPETASELDLDDIYKPGSSLDMPKRPTWDYTMSREALDAREEKYFRKYVERIFESYTSSKISYFELNLETWRQLWRVVEMSDIILLITDIRHPALHFSPALYDHVVKDLKKQMILVLNKIDLAPPALVVAWKHFFQSQFPELCIICFTSFPKEAAEREKLNEDPALTLQKRRRRRAATAVGPKQLLVACEEIVHGAVDLKSWKQKIEYDFCGPEDDEGPEVLQEHVEEADTSYHQHQSYGSGILTIGCCGYPNVGKSSLINGLVGKKVVSVSRTPGHTKHFQTIFLTPSVKLCDCPGLVFPSLVSKPLQVLSGIFPIAQLREPYTAIRFLAERMNLPQLLKLKHPEVELNEKPPDPAILKWSAFDICDAWAEKRGFMTAKAARNDVYRAANHLLRMASEGRLCLCMKPRGYSSSKDKWIQHPDTAAIEKLQEMHRKAVEFSEEEDEEEEEDDDDDEPVRGRDDEDSDEEDESETIVASASANPFALLADDDD